MKFAIQINCSPYQSNSWLDAYHFCRAARQLDHDILRIFFYQEGAYHAFGWASPADDEINFVKMWSTLAEQHDLDLVVCVSAAQRRGLLGLDEAARRGKQDNDLAPGFRIGGLGLWVEAAIQADRCLFFG